MHYIDLDLVELELPDDWEETVDDANEYVAEKIQSAEESARVKAEDEGLEGEEAEAYIQKAKDKARKAAISYKNIWSSLSAILSKQSNGKCWYCETKENRSDNPIDHFRPKNKVIECVGHPGYWWLAFDWKNYRFACTYCNSRRIDVNTEGGKHDHFPLLPPAIWNRCETDNHTEYPALLDPCDIDDSSLLTYNINGSACAITDDENAEEYVRASTSIHLYHLNQIATKRARKSIYQSINRLVNDTNQLIDRGIDANREQIKSNRKKLMNMVRHSCPDTQFNSAAKTYLRGFSENSWVMDILQRV
ncbi:hypothetical protein WCX72_05550 [Sulfurimonas sp. HSL1-6]|uniref:hypothetical protein n=1 Tax=Thiomicrolovo immobilis TaxID=3131935 RepID=UPI0031F76B9E